MREGVDHNQKWLNWVLATGSGEVRRGFNASRIVWPDSPTACHLEQSAFPNGQVLSSKSRGLQATQTHLCRSSQLRARPPIAFKGMHREIARAVAPLRRCSRSSGLYRGGRSWSLGGGARTLLARQGECECGAEL